MPVGFWIVLAFSLLFAGWWLYCLWHPPEGLDFDQALSRRFWMKLGLLTILGTWSALLTRWLSSSPP